MPRGRPKKNPYDILSEEFKSKVSGLTWEEMNDEIASVAKAEQDNLQAKSDDPDLASLKEQVKDASSPYTSQTKENKTKLQYIREYQDLKGKLVSKPE